MSRLRLLVLGLLSIAILAVTAAQAAPAAQAPSRLISLEACSTSLVVELNVQNQTPKYQLVEALKVLADYPRLSITPAHSEQSAVAFNVVVNAYCANAKVCARETGWTDLQKRLLRLKGVRLSCEGQGSIDEASDVGGGRAEQAPGGGAAPRPPGRAREGGVTGSN